MADLLDIESFVGDLSPNALKDAINLLEAEVEQAGLRKRKIGRLFQSIFKPSKREAMKKEAMLEALKEFQEQQQAALERSRRLATGATINQLSFNQVVAQFI